MLSNNSVPKNNGSSNIKVNNKTTNNSSLIKKVILVIGIIIVIFFIYTLIRGYQNYQKYSPFLIDGIIDATTAMQFKAAKIPKSSDSQYGTEFSYSFWMYINDTNFSKASATGTCAGSAPLLHVLHKGSYDYIPTGQSTTSGSDSDTYYPLLQMPGVWLYPNTNKLNIRFNTYENVVETADVGNIPLNMWVSIVIILIGGSVDVYINGNLKKRQKLQGVPKINYGDLYVTNWGGFLGYLSKVRYFNYAIQPFLVEQIFKLGPGNTFATNGPGLTPTPTLAPNYWMTSGYPNSVGYPGYNQPT